MLTWYTGLMKAEAQLLYINHTEAITQLQTLNKKMFCHLESFWIKSL